jgi:hypothetical protein
VNDFKEYHASDPFFTPEDFMGMLHTKHAATLANDKLQKHLEGLPVVVGNIEFDCWASEMGWHKDAHMRATHTARLFAITPIQPERAAETAESLIKEFVERIDGSDAISPWAIDFLSRAKALLAKAGE